MDMQNVAKLNIPEGEVRTIHDKDGNLIWGKVSYGVKYKGDTSQQTYTGKNLVYTGAKTSSGITATYDAMTGTTTVKGTAETYTYAVFNSHTSNIPAGTYTFSIQATAPVAVGVGIRVDGGARQAKPIAVGSTKTTFTTTGVITSNDIYLTGLTVGTYYEFSFKAMLEAGSTATSFEPYVGGVPAPNPDYPQAVQTVTSENVVKISDGQGNEQSYEVNLGKNLFDVSSITEQTAASTNGTENHEVTYSTNDNRAVTLIKVEPNTTYKLSIGDTSYSSRIYFVGMKNTTLESGHSFGWCANGATLTTGSKDAYLLGVIEALQGGTVSALTNAKIQLEKGSQVTSYAVYFEPIELCKIGTYQDSIYKSGGKWYVEKNTAKIASYAGEAISTDYISTTGQLTTGATVYYALATPTDTEITNETLVAQLEAVEQWLIRYGYNATVSGNLPIIIDRTAL